MRRSVVWVEKAVSSGSTKGALRRMRSLVVEEVRQLDAKKDEGSSLHNAYGHETSVPFDAMYGEVVEVCASDQVVSQG